jgi:hypothetical protein
MTLEGDFVVGSLRQTPSGKEVLRAALTAAQHDRKAGDAFQAIEKQLEKITSRDPRKEPGVQLERPIAQQQADAGKNTVLKTLQFGLLAVGVSHVAVSIGQYVAEIKTGVPVKVAGQSAFGNDMIGFGTSVASAGAGRSPLDPRCLGQIRSPRGRVHCSAVRQ